MKRLWCRFFGHRLHYSTDDWGVPYIWCERCLKVVLPAAAGKGGKG